MASFLKAQWYFDGELYHELSDKNFQDFFGEHFKELKQKTLKFTELIHPEDRENYLHELKTYLSDLKKGNQLEFNHQPYRINLGHGHMKRFEEQKSLKKSSTSSHYLIESVYFDNTETLEKLERLQLIHENTGLGLWEWNPQTNEVIFDQQWARMLGLNLEDIDKTLDSWSRRVHPDDINACFDEIAAHIEGNKSSYENIHRMKHENGHWLYIWDRGKIVERDARGEAIRFTGMQTDITDLYKDL